MILILQVFFLTGKKLWAFYKKNRGSHTWTYFLFKKFALILEVIQKVKRNVLIVKEYWKRIEQVRYVANLVLKYAFNVSSIPTFVYLQDQLKHHWAFIYKKCTYIDHAVRQTISLSTAIAAARCFAAHISFLCYQGGATRVHT